MNKKKCTVVLTGLCVILLGICAVSCLKKDRRGPEIQFSDIPVTYAQGDDTSVLLEGVTATDGADGDVTDSLKVDRVTEIQGMNYVVVTYVAKDSKNNITKQERWIDLSDGASSSEPMVDIGSIDEEETEFGTTGEVQHTEEQEVYDQPETMSEAVTETEPETETEERLVSTGAPIIRISTHDLKLSVGQHFECLDYVKECVDDVDTQNQLFSRIVVNGEDEYGNYVGNGTINTSYETGYTLQYYVVDTDGNMSNIETMKVTVSG